MTPADLDKTKKKVMASYEPYSGVDLMGMVEDCHAYLSQSPLIQLAQRETRRTGNEQSMVVVPCISTSSTAAIQDIAIELERIWMNDLCFDEEMHVVAQVEGAVVLDFVSWWLETKTYVTGNIVVDTHSSTDAHRAAPRLDDQDR